MKALSRIPGGTVHTVPQDVRQGLLLHRASVELWNTLTPLGRNEWLCWIVTVQKKETREQHLERMLAELQGGRRRPCCWAGCPHRAKHSRV